MSSIVQLNTKPQAHPITVAYGDGIGPEIMEAVLKILAEARVPLNIDTIEVGQKFYEKGVTTGIPPAAWDSIRRTKTLLKAPITTPQGGGYKSLNVTMRKSLGLYANVRPCTSFHPYIKSMHANMNLVIIRENEEDLYAGIEYRQTQDAFQSVKIITRSGSERIMRYAFEYAVNNNRKKVTCMSKDNIMKLTDGAFHDMFTMVAKEYPHIEADHYIIDIGSARIASKPHIFDVIVTENLFGDIISDIAAEVSGSVGLAGSANIGANYAMFEAIHGSAPDIAGKDIANPSGLLHGAIMMLGHLGLNDDASKLHNAWLKTIEDGTHTVDIFNDMSKRKVGTKDFAQAVIDNIGAEPSTYRPVKYSAPKGGHGRHSRGDGERNREACARRRRSVHPLVRQGNRCARHHARRTLDPRADPKNDLLQRPQSLAKHHDRNGRHRPLSRPLYAGRKRRRRDAEKHRRPAEQIGG